MTKIETLARKRRHAGNAVPCAMLLRMGLLFGLLQISVNTFSQKVTFSGKNVALLQVFKVVEKQTGYVFFFDENINEALPVSIVADNMPLDTFLTNVFRDQPLKYLLQGKTIVVSRKTPVKKPAIAPGNNAASDSNAKTAFQMTGLVYGEKGVPLSGATIHVKGTRYNIMTDAKGVFLLKDVNAGSILEVSFIGYETREQAVKPGSMVIELAPSGSKLDEVQIIAFGKTTARLSTGNVSTVKAEDLEKTASPNVLQALQGYIPGLNITQAGSNASAAYNITLRGYRSVQSNPLSQNLGAINTPLIVIDGFPLSTGVSNDDIGGLMPPGSARPGYLSGFSPLFNINPNDIESVTVLKDADATSLYGSMGANGVILINTKKSKSSKMTASASVNYGFTQTIHNLTLLNTEQYLSMRREAFANDKITPNNTSAYDLLVWDTTRYTDWQKQLVGTRPTIDVNMNVSGGQANTTYRLSAGYFKDMTGIPGAPDGFVKGSSESRVTFGLTTSTQSANARLKLSSQVAFTNSISTLPNVNLETLIYLAPDAPALFTPDGKINWNEWRVAGATTLSNSVGALANPTRNDSKNWRLGANVSYQLMPGLLFSLRGGYDITQIDGYVVNSSRASTDPLLTATRTTTFGNNTFSSLSVEPTLTYSLSKGVHNFSFLAGSSYNYNNRVVETLTGEGWLSDELQTNVSGATSILGTVNYSQIKFLSFYGRINYNFADKYILNFNGRRDGSSNFGPGNKYGNFGSIGAAWIFSKEPWLRSLLQSGIMSFGKLRGSYGITGSPVSSPYSYLSTYNTPTYARYQNAPTYIITRPANPNVHWSQTKKEELGLDLGFFKDRLLVVVSAYQDFTTDQVTFSPLSATTGFPTALFNLGATVRNQGMEASVNYRSNPIRALKWSAGINFSHNNNKLMDFPNIENSVYALLYKVGASLNRTLVYNSFIDPKTGLYPAPTALVQDYYTVDPPVTIGMQMQVSYKGFSISGNFTAAKQVGLQGYKVVGMPGSISAGKGNQPVNVLGRWQKPDDESFIPRFTTTGTGDYAYQTRAFYGDASYLALKNAVLSYNIPQKLLKKTGIENLSLAVRADNIFFLTHYIGSNPETPSSNLQLLRRRVNIGLNLTF